MSKLGRSIAGALAALGLFAGSAYAGETVFTDQGWYRVEGSAPTPLPDQGEGALTVEPAPAAQPAQQASGPARAPQAASQPAPAQPFIPPEAAPAAPPCLAERGKLARRLLTLHGLEVSRIDVRDGQLGALASVAAGAPLPFTSALSVDPDLNLLENNVPIPPSAANWDEEARWDWNALLACQARY